MSNKNYESQHMQSEQLPPFQDRHDGGGIGWTLPTLLTLGGGLAALWLLENQTHAVSRTAAKARDAAEDWWHDTSERAHGWFDEAGERARHLRHDAGEWTGRARHRAGEAAHEWGESASDGLVSAGAKALGIASTLAALGGGGLSAGTKRAAQMFALKKMADYASSVRSSPQFKAGMKRARAAGHEGSERLRGAYAALRGERRHESEWGFGTVAFLGLGLISAGAAAAYLMSPTEGPQRRRALRLRAQAAGRQASEWASGVADSARELAGTAAERVSGRISELDDEEVVRKVRQTLAGMLEDIGDLRVSAANGLVRLSGHLPEDRREALLEAARRIAGVREVEYAPGTTDSRRSM